MKFLNSLQSLMSSLLSEGTHLITQTAISQEDLPNPIEKSHFRSIFY